MEVFAITAVIAVVLRCILVYLLQYVQRKITWSGCISLVVSTTSRCTDTTSRCKNTRTSTQIQREYNARLGRTTPVQREIQRVQISFQKGYSDQIVQRCADTNTSSYH